MSETNGGGHFLFFEAIARVRLRKLIFRGIHFKTSSFKNDIFSEAGVIKCLSPKIDFQKQTLYKARLLKCALTISAHQTRFDPHYKAKLRFEGSLISLFSPYPPTPPPSLSPGAASSSDLRASSSSERTSSSAPPPPTSATPPPTADPARQQSGPRPSVVDPAGHQSGPSPLAVDPAGRRSGPSLPAADPARRQRCHEASRTEMTTHSLVDGDDDGARPGQATSACARLAEAMAAGATLDGLDGPMDGLHGPI